MPSDAEFVCENAPATFSRAEAPKVILPELLKFPAVVKVLPLSKLRLPALMLRGAMPGNIAPGPSKITAALLIATVSASVTSGFVNFRVALENTCQVPAVSVLQIGRASCRERV